MRTCTSNTASSKMGVNRHRSGRSSFALPDSEIRLKVLQAIPRTMHDAFIVATEA